MAADITNLNKVRYSGLDFDTLEDDLKGRLQVQFAADFNDFALSSLGIMLLDVIAFGLDTLSFYLDRRATDNFLATARTRKSVANLTRQLGYKMSTASPAVVDLNVSLTQAYAFPVPIPKGFQWQGPNGVIFESAEEVTFAAGTGPATVLHVPCYQGETITENFVSDGTANQVFELRKVPSGAAIAAGTVVVTVDGSPFAETEFLDFQSTDQFEVGYNDAPPTLRFGNGATGNIPKSGAAISVTYVATLGEQGRVAKNTIEEPVVPLTVAFTAIPLTVSNPNSSVGGDGLEDLEHAKSYAGRYFKSRKFAVTSEDYQTLANTFSDPLFGRVAAAQAVSSRSAASDVELSSFISTIRSYTSAYAVIIRSDISDSGGIEDLVTTTLGVLTSIQSDLSSIAAQSLQAQTSANAVVALIKSAQKSVGSVTENLTDLTTEATDIQSVVTAIPDGVSDQLLLATKTTLLTSLGAVISSLTLLSSFGTSASTALQSTESSLKDVLDAIKAIGTTTSGVGTDLLHVAQQHSETAVATLGDSATPSGVFAKTANILTHVSTDVETTIASAVDGIWDHVDALLSADCKANVVSVPILSKDAGGFYVPPSNSLIKALQKHLDARKEVTQTVFVVSGGDNIVQPVIQIRVGCRGQTAAVVAASVTAVVDGLLKNRPFGKPLFNSDVVDAIKASVPGFVYVNVTISGYTRPGSSTILTDKTTTGNLEILSTEVISKNTTAANITVQAIEA